MFVSLRRFHRCHDVAVSLKPDHLVVCVVDLEAGHDDFADRFGLASIPGGRHPDHGTANRIVPLGASYIELVAVVDEAEASASPFGSWVGSNALRWSGIDAVCLRTDDILAIGVRLGIEPVPMSRVKPDGSTLSWQLAGVEHTISEGLPFFVEWSVPEEDLPGRNAIDHPVGPATLELVEIVGELERLESWVVGVTGVRLSAGAPSIHATVRSPRGTIQL